MSLKKLLTSPDSGTYRKTKIIATLGPKSRSAEALAALIDAGVNLFRLNFSHGSHQEHSETLATVREVARAKGSYVGILQDLSGPKIRITEVVDANQELRDGATVDLRFSDGSKSTAQTIFVESLDPATVLAVGQHALLADGMITLRAVAIKGSAVQCLIVKGGRIRSKVGIAFPDSAINLPATTDKDLKDLTWGIQNNVDYVAISFVNYANDVLRLRDFIRKLNGDARIIAKIERRQAVENIEEILAVSDGLMVARGDLGVELPLEKVPNVQRLLIEQANYRGIPVIVATQMLQSMVTSLRPTRAEASDVATAVMSGADAVMLSEETTIGEHPVECVKYLHRIAIEAERSFAFDEYKLRLRDADRATVPDAVAYAASAAAIKVNAGAIIACTETGTTARLVAKYRPQQPLYGISSSEKTLRRMSLYWGVKAIGCDTSGTHSDELNVALRAVQQREKLRNGTRAVVTGGVSARNPGSTSLLEIREMSFLERGE